MISSFNFIYLINSIRISNENSKPSDRSIFRKNIRRALLNKQKNFEYLKIWNIDFTNSANRKKFAHLRNTNKEKNIEAEITSIIRQHFYFRYIPFIDQEQRMGKVGIESRLIGTVTKCKICHPSSNWLGKHSPLSKISSGKLWLYQHLDSVGLTNLDETSLLKDIKTVSEPLQF